TRGKMGYALADAAFERGASVTLVSGPTNFLATPGVKINRTKATKELERKMNEEFKTADIAIMAEAVSDYHAAKVADNKSKITGEVLKKELVQNPDILKGLGSVKEKQILVGFAAETNNLYENAQNNLLSKHADMIVGNDVSRKDIGFGNDDNEVTLFTLKNSPIKLSKTNKKDLSHKILDVIVEKLMSKE